MAFLKFLKGNYSSLNNAAIAEGQVLICGDTGEMFVDVAADKRVKIGDYITVANIAALEALDATSVPTSRLYYVEDGNILARSNGTTWVQINKQPDIATLKTQLGLGSMAYLSEVSESNLSTELAAKVNASAQANHSHDNKTVLDGITAEKVSAWDAAEGNAKGYADGLNTAMNTRVEALEAVDHEHANKALLDTYTQTEANLADAVAKKHEHDNKTELDKIAAGDVAKWNGVVADHLVAADKTELADAIGDVSTELGKEVDRAKAAEKANSDAIAAIKDGASVDSFADVEAELAKKVDKVTGKSLIADSEITRLAGMSDGANKVEASATNGSIKIDGVDTVVYTHPEKHAIADVTGLQDALNGLQAKGDYAAEEHTHTKSEITDFAHTHVASEITDLDSTIKGYNYATKTEAQGYADAKDGAIQAAQKTADDLAAYVGTFTASEGIDTVVEYIDAKTANIASDERVNGIENRVKAIEDDYVVAADIANFETKENVKKVADDLAEYVEANDEALAGVKAIAEAARTEEEVNSQIDTKISALNLGTTYEPIGAEDRAKAYVDQKFTDADLAQYTTEAEVKSIVDGVIAAASDGTTMDSLTQLVDYIEAHGGEATEMATAISTLEGKVETIEGKPAYGITATQVSNWDGEVGAKALAETKLDASTFTEYSTAHANDYTNKQIDDAIDADVKAAIDAEVLRANGAYDAKGAAADAQAAAIADAAEKYETKGTAQGIVDGLKLSETYEPIGAESRAIAAAKTETEKQVKALADGAVAENTSDIADLFAQMQWGSF